MASGKGKQARDREATRRETRVRDEGWKAAEAPLVASAGVECRAMWAQRSYLAPFFATGVFFAGVGALAASASCEPVEKLTRLPAGM